MPFVKELVNLPFYWGKLTHKKAEEILSKRPIGSFLIRHCSSGFLAVSVRSDDPQNIVQDYVPYGKHKNETDNRDKIIKIIKEMTPARFPVLRKTPSLYTVLHNQSQFLVFVQLRHYICLLYSSQKMAIDCTCQNRSGS